MENKTIIKMIYIQSNSEKNLPHHFDAACAMYGAIESGHDFKTISNKTIPSIIDEFKKEYSEYLDYYKKNRL